MGERLAKKLWRLKELERLLLDVHPRGLHKAELARRIGIDRSEIPEYLDDLAEIGVQVYDTDDGKHAIDPATHRVNLRLSLDESLAVLLAVRLLTTRTDKRNPHAAGALRELASAFDKLAPFIARHIRQSASAVDGEHRRDDPFFLRWLERLTQAWARQVKVRLDYESDEGRFTTHTFAPYFIEPYAVGHTVHVIGWSDSSGKRLTFKVERIRNVELLAATYDIPADFDPTDILRDAWGIWRMEGEPVLVRLRFDRRVAYRVRETQWHYREEVEEDEAGGLIWQARISQPREMIPWIRGWGADVEVLEPGWLRDALVREARRLARVYQIVAEDPRERFYAHSKDGLDKSEWQPLIEHITNTADLAVEFGEDAGVAGLARIAGLTHDLGKYAREFQQRLEGAPLRVDHSTAGAKELCELFKNTPQETVATLLAYCISGHHTGLLDYGSGTDVPGDGTLMARLKTKVCDYRAYTAELDLRAIQFPERLHIRPLKSQPGFSVAFLTRMVFSALVDADFQETETYMQGRQPRGEHEGIEALCQKFNAHLSRFENPETDINRKRTETLKACIAKAEEAPGFFTLTVPTGGGKTLASMAFALNHAVKHGMKRIVYVIPFTSIIEQNAGVFKDILGEENVLEHHSNFDWEQKKREASESVDDLTNSAYAKLRLAAENWDIPVVVTTNVQFFESLFANKPSRCRKLHNIASSVIIFDEAQLFPRDHLLPAMDAVWELVTNYGASAVFCTATQPDLGRFLPAGTTLTELALNPKELFDFYRRVEVKNLERLPDDALTERLSIHEQALCIVNTRRHASGLFQKLQGEGNFHLSTLMCPAHRKKKLAEIRQRLDDGRSCRVISTSVMEAGIDVDFPVGYRALTGLDSVNQAAGRVNRNMKRATGELYIFEPDSEFIRRTPRYVAQGTEVARGVLRDYGSAPISIPAIEVYFDRLYALKDRRDFDYKDILGCFASCEPHFRFATAAERFRVIEDITETVIIPYDDAANRLIEELKFTQYPSFTLRKLQPYTVSIYRGEFDALSSQGVILTIAEAYAVLNPDSFHDYYDLDRGLLVPASGGGEGLFF